MFSRTSTFPSTNLKQPENNLSPPRLGTPLQLQPDRAPSPKGPIAVDAEPNEGVVTIGKGTRIVGQIIDCEKLEIQGDVEGEILAKTLVIRRNGSVKGRIQADHAEVHGQIIGQLQVTDILDVRANGRVEGELSYGRLSVAMGGYISGQVASEQAGLSAALENSVPIPADFTDASNVLHLHNEPPNGA